MSKITYKNLLFSKFLADRTHFLDISLANHNITDVDSFKSYNPHLNIVNSLYLFHTSETEVLKVINKMKLSNSSSYDGISSKVIKSAAEQLSSLLTRLSNNCLDSCCFQTPLKFQR